VLRRSDESTNSTRYPPAPPVTTVSEGSGSGFSWATLCVGGGQAAALAVERC
jgi:hypothetical protein